MNVNDVITGMLNDTEKRQAENRVTGTTELGQDAFLQLLMTQLRYQDPLNPLGNQEFIAQQAQFTQISELQKLNKSVNKSNDMMQASSLIGKTVSLPDPDEPTETIEGKVTEAKLSANGASIVIDGKSYPMESITSIKEVQ